MIDSELISIVRLLPDEDSLIQTAVCGRLLERGEDVLADLMDLIQDTSRVEELSVGTGVDALQMKKIISSRVAYLCREFAFRKLEILSRDEYPSLNEVFLLISRILYPDTDAEEFLSEVNSMAAEAASEINEKQTAVEQIEIFNHIFFHRLGFGFGDISRSDAGYFMIPSVVKSRRGYVLSILLIYFMLARYADIDICPVVIRGCVIPLLSERGEALFFLDIKNEGEIIHQDDFFASLADAGLDNFEPDVREDRILPVIYLESLLWVFSGSGDVYGQKNAAAVRLIERALSLFGPERFMTDSGGSDEEDGE